MNQGEIISLAYAKTYIRILIPNFFIDIDIDLPEFAENEYFSQYFDWSHFQLDTI